MESLVTCPYRLVLGDAMDVLRGLEPGSVDAVVTDPPYGMAWDTDSTRFSGGVSPLGQRYRGQGRADWGDISGDSEPFDPSPWLEFPRVVLWGANHFAERLPTGTTLVWVKKADHLFGSFLSDAEIGWMKGGHGVYCHRKQFPPPARMEEAGSAGRCVHPTQKPVSLMAWAMRRAKIEPGMTVLDPFMGSGTTGVACAEEGFRFVGVEREERYFKIAEARIKQAFAQKRLFA